MALRLEKRTVYGALKDYWRLDSIELSLVGTRSIARFGLYTDASAADLYAPEEVMEVPFFAKDIDLTTDLRPQMEALLRVRPGWEEAQDVTETKRLD